MTAILIVLIVMALPIKDKPEVPAGSILTAIVTLTTAFFGANVGDKMAKGKFYRAELDSENPNRYEGTKDAG
jgi:hypothetical protein